MEMEVQKFETHGTVDTKGNIQETADHPVGKPVVSEFGAPNDLITAIVGGAYISQWDPDFLSKPLGTSGICHRFYSDARVIVDIGDPGSKLAGKKRQLLFENGFAYFCVPEHFPQDHTRMKALYESCLEEYRAYEELHPRPVQLQRGIVVDEKGNIKEVTVKARDVKVGGGYTSSIQEQKAELEAAKATSSSRLKELKAKAKTMRAIRRAHQEGKPFRNPFVAKGKRLYQVAYPER